MTIRRTPEQAAIAFVVGQLGITRGHVVEFGAWDGVRLSNSRELIAQGWTGLLMEADPTQFAALEQNVAHPGVRVLCRRVGTSGEHSLDAILSSEDCPPQFELLSIDIDSDDLAVWKTLRRFRPRIVVIEYNVTIPFDVEFVNPPTRHWGNSALSIYRHAQSTRYDLVAIAGMSLVFVDRDAGGGHPLEAIALDRSHTKTAPRYFWGYDGTLLTSDAANPAPSVVKVPWHSFVFAQPLPRPLRRWNLARRLARMERAVAFALLMVRPMVALGLVIRRYRRR